MPHPAVAAGAVVAVSVAVATAVAIYESPELRRYADDVRRRIAVALHSMGDNINPAYREPLFNRPEDADGFLESRHGAGAEDGVDADEETRRRQRIELLYWNTVRMEKQAMEEKQREAEEREKEKPALLGNRPRGSSFDDFLRQDENAEQGTFVFNTGADTRAMHDGLRHRGQPSHLPYTNPFADEHHIDAEELNAEASIIGPTMEEFSDIYSATTRDDQNEKLPLSPEPVAAVLFDAEAAPARSETESSATLDRELGPDEFMTAGQEDRHNAYSSIQAWAENSSPDFYSPLPVTPTAPVSEPELLSDGQLTPTDSMSIIGSTEDVADVANDAQSSRDGETGRYYDVMSESSGMMTPASWSEVGSVISESDAPIPTRA
ncbi:hypothetical protein B0T10DRAFT_478933 [Thelonectria olida]|uniref:Uncharacterized protein n=1 Tax=Thelonectria olida TaxID=1576542 RepID=A0A9P8WCU8_9HYPO|nr:hypothetical protein B0T10DRAFT_478933 [Thelonectria olida]